MVKVLFVCFGNICRSPMAQGALTRLLEREGLLEQVEVSSAGTHTYHLSSSPDERARRAMQRRGIDIGGISAKRLAPDDFQRFDYLIAMDRDNFRFLQEQCPEELRGKLSMLMDYAPHFHAAEVPDPYYGPEIWFDRVLDMIDAAAEGLLSELRRRHFL